MCSPRWPPGWSHGSIASWSPMGLSGAIRLVWYCKPNSKINVLTIIKRRSRYLESAQLWRRAHDEESYGLRNAGLRQNKSYIWRWLTFVLLFLCSFIYYLRNEKSNKTETKELNRIFVKSRESSELSDRRFVFYVCSLFIIY